MFSSYERDLSDFAGGSLHWFVRLNPPTANATIKLEFECNPEPGIYPNGVSYSTFITDHGWQPNNQWQEIVVPLVDSSFSAFDVSTAPFTPITRPLDDACLSTVTALAKTTLEGVDSATIFATMLIDYIRWEKPNTLTVATKVETQGRQLLVNGKPFVVNAVDYAPVGIGQNWRAAWQDRADRYDVDFPLIADMGANAVRLYAPVLTKAMLDKAWMEGLFVIPTFGIDSIQLTCSNGRRFQQDRFVEKVKQWKDHPAILLWLAGNEVNGNLGSANLCADWYPQLDDLARRAHVAEAGGVCSTTTTTACTDDDDCAPGETCVLLGSCSVSTTTACFKGTEDTDCPASETCVFPDYHPVGTANSLTGAPTPGINDICKPSCSEDSDLPNVDFWGVQAYRGNTFGTLFTDYQAKNDCDRPLIVTEFGVDAYDDRPPAGENQLEHANFLDSLLGEAHEELAVRTPGGVLSGQAIFEWADEWWKAECGGTSWLTHDTCSSSPNSDFFDGDVHQEWFGIATLKPKRCSTSETPCNFDGQCPGAETCIEPAERDLRTAYDTVGGQWLGPVCTMKVDAFDAGTGNATISFSPAAGNAVDHTLHYGPLSAVSTYGYSATVTGLGTTGSSAVTLPAGDLFWVVAAENPSAKEGCYGTDSAGVERPCFSGNCEVDQISGWNCWCQSP